MTEPERPQEQQDEDQGVTEPMATVSDQDSTRELPPVAPTAVAQPAAQPPSAVEQPASSPAPSASLPEPRSQPQSKPPAGPATPVAMSMPSSPQTMPTSRQAGRPTDGPWLAVLLTLLVAGLLTAGVLLVWLQLRGSTPAASPGAAKEPVTLTSTKVSSVDPSGGSGFRREGEAVWRTQTYRSAEFGNLKPGVGLLLDVGRQHRLSAVTFDAVTQGITVQLHTGDQAGDDPNDYRPVGKPQQASGNTSLAAGSAGAHRYWLVWVTRLTDADGGFHAEIRNPVARATG